MPPSPDVTARILSVTHTRFQLISYEKKELEDILQNGIQTTNIPAINALISQSSSPDNHPPSPLNTGLASTPRDPEEVKQEPTETITVFEDKWAKPSSSVSIRGHDDYCSDNLEAIDLEYDIREMESMFEDVQTRHSRVYGDRSRLTLSEMRDAQDAYWKICQLQESLQGPLNVMDDQIYYRVLESTGIDIDRRRVYFLSYLEYFDSWMVRDIRFFKNLPGFKQLTLHDRTALTKSTFSVFGFVKDFRGWDRARRIVVGEEGLTAFCVDKTVRVFPDFALTLAGLLEVYDDLLTYDPCPWEMTLIKAVLVMTPYTYESLEHPEMVRQWYNKYLSCMLCLIRKLHGIGPYADERFSQLLAVLEKLKHLRSTFREFMQSTVERLLKLIDSEQAMIFREVFAYFKYEADDSET